MLSHACHSRGVQHSLVCCNLLVLFSKRNIVIELPVKLAPWFSVYNWQVASCEYKQYCDVVLQNVFTEKREVSLTKI